MKEFRYDVKILIQGVKDRPCLWNRSLDVYKDRFERRNAWEEIFNLLDETYETMPAEEKRLTGEHIVNKWTNIRDTFVKTLRTKMGKAKRQYLYHDLLKFLIGEIRGEDHGEYVEDSNVAYMKEEHASEEEVQPQKRSKRLEKSDDCYKETSFKDISHSTRKKSKKKATVEPEEPSNAYEASTNNAIDFVEVEESDSRLMNEDEAFFASLLPTVVKYNEDERLEFRIEVLNVMKKIKDSKRWSNGDS